MLLSCNGDLRILLGGLDQESCHSLKCTLTPNYRTDSLKVPYIKHFIDSWEFSVEWLGVLGVLDRFFRSPPAYFRMLVTWTEDVILHNMAGNGGVDMQATQFCGPWCHNSQASFTLQREFGTVMTPWWQHLAEAQDAKTALRSVQNVQCTLSAHTTVYMLAYVWIFSKYIYFLVCIYI